MRWVKNSAASALLAIALCGVGRAADKQAKSIKLPDDNNMATLKPGPGVDVVRANCAICHSTDYIVRQPGGDAKHWLPEVKKMVTVFGASISDAEVKTITDYLVADYGAATEPGAKDSPQGAATPKKTKKSK